MIAIEMAMDDRFSLPVDYISASVWLKAAIGLRRPELLDKANGLKYVTRCKTNRLPVLFGTEIQY